MHIDPFDEDLRHRHIVLCNPAYAEVFVIMEIQAQAGPASAGA